MSDNDKITSRAESLVEEYANTNGIDSSTCKMYEILEEFKKTKKISFKDLILLSGMLGVSPDYITGLSDKKEQDNLVLSKLLSNIMRLNKDNVFALYKKSEIFLDMQENLIDYNEAGIVISEYTSEGELISQITPSKPNTVSLVAEPKAVYKKSNKKKYKQNQRH